jgi:hypothetical protein
MRARYSPTYLELKEIELLLDEEARLRALRPRRKLFGASISNDFGKTWNLKSLCSECIKSINFEPPTMIKNTGESGTFTCEMCDCINEMYKE